MEYLKLKEPQHNEIRNYLFYDDSYKDKDWVYPENNNSDKYLLNIMFM